LLFVSELHEDFDETSEPEIRPEVRSTPRRQAGRIQRQPNQTTVRALHRSNQIGTHRPGATSPELIFFSPFSYPPTPPDYDNNETQQSTCCQLAQKILRPTTTLNGT